MPAILDLLRTASAQAMHPLRETPWAYLELADLDAGDCNGALADQEWTCGLLIPRKLPTAILPSSRPGLRSERPSKGWRKLKDIAGRSKAVSRRRRPPRAAGPPRGPGTVPGTLLDKGVELDVQLFCPLEVKAVAAGVSGVVAAVKASLKKAMRRGRHVTSG